MRKYSTAIHRRRFLQQSAALGLGILFTPALASKASAATKDRVAIYQGVGLDSLHPYGYSGGGITGIWRHIIEPLIQMDYDRNEYVGVLAQSWEFQGRKWIFHLRKVVRFHNGAPLTSKDVAYSIDKLQNDKRSLHAPTCKASSWRRPTITPLFLRPGRSMRFCPPGWRPGLFSRRNTAIIWTAPRRARDPTNTSAGSAAATWCCGANDD